jgi:capsular polysaccharide biosynthesis protein
VYHNDGRLVESAAYYRGPDKLLVGQSKNTTLRPSTLPFMDEELIYGGPFIMHYGHFLAAALPRLWHLRGLAGSRLRIVCHGHEGPRDWFALDYVRSILSALGLREENFVQIDRPTVIRRLWVPCPAMEEQNFVHRALDDVGQAIGRSYHVHLEQRSDRPIYLSKTRLGLGITRFQDEQVLEDLLADRGFEIVHPQELSFPEQVRQFARARAIVATIGSGLHSSLFLDRPSRVLALVGANNVNSNYILIDRLKGNDSLYLYPEAMLGGRPDDGGFQLTFTIEDMPAVAKAFADLV